MVILFIMLFISLFVINIYFLIKSVKTRDNKNWLILFSLNISSIISLILIVYYLYYLFPIRDLGWDFLLFLLLVVPFIFILIFIISLILKIIEVAKNKRQNNTRKKLHSNIIRKAKEKGIGTIAMKPLAGGNLDNRPLALRFIAASGVCDISIPGMGDVAEVDKNAAVRENLSPLTEAELEEAEKAKKELGSRFCRRCGYCAPCTVGIDIPSNFLFVNYLRKYGLADWAAERYRTLKVNASDCIQCGACEQRCPYNLPIRQMLKGVVSDFARYEESKKY